MINVNGGYLYKLLSISYPTFILKVQTVTSEFANRSQFEYV